MKKITLALTAVIIGSLFNCTNIYAAMQNQVFIDGYKLNHTIESDGRVYVQMRELAHYIGYNLEYDPINHTVSAYKDGDEKPVVVRESFLFPVNVEEIDFDKRKEIIKVYELSANENPQEISREPFEKNGYRYVLTDVTKSSTEGVDTREHTETVTVNTNSQDTNTILKQLQETMEYVSYDGYKGVLKLDISSIQSGVKGYNSSNYTVTEKREYPNLSNSDTSLIPKTLTVGGKTLKLASVDWKAANNTAIDYEPLADTYTAIATYTGTGTKTSVSGYTTTAVYNGEISKTIQGKTVYTAYFTGTEISPEPTATPEPKELTKKELEQQLKELKDKEKAERKGIDINPIVIVIPLLALAGIGGFAYLLFFRRNVTVFSSCDGKFKKIGKTRADKKNPIIDLTPFTAKVTTPSFIVILDMFAAKSLNDKTVTINYGDSSFQHIVTVVNDEGNKKRDYQIEVDF